MSFRDIRMHGNRFAPDVREMLGYAPGSRPGNSAVQCADGFRFSVIAGWGARCRPRPDMDVLIDDRYPGPYWEVECGFWDNKLPKPAHLWRRYFDGRRPFFAGATRVYNYVPVAMVYDLIHRHGGEISPDPERLPAMWRERRDRSARNCRREWDHIRNQAAQLEKYLAEKENTCKIPE